MARSLTPRLSRLVAAWCVGVGTLLAVAGTASAAAPATGGLTVTPGELNFSLSKDAPSQTIPVSISNHYSADVALNAAFKGIDETAGILVPKGEVESNLAPALSVSASNFVVPAGQTQTIQVKLTNLPSLSPGGHYATLILTQQGSESGKLNLRAAVSLSIFAVKVQGAHPKLQLTGFSTNGWLFHMPSNATLHFKNTGNVLVVPRAAIVVQRYGTVNPLSQGIANANSLPLLPGNQLTSVAPLTRLRRVFLPAHLQIAVAYRYDGEPQPGLVTRRIWYIPPIWPILVLLVIGVVVLRRRSKQSPKKSSDTTQPAQAKTKPPREVVKPTVVEQSRQSIAVDHEVASEAVEVVTPVKVVAGDLGTIKPPKPRKKPGPKPTKKAAKKPAAKKSNPTKSPTKRKPAAKAKKPKSST